jgi:tetratricopeptide (TPR) repeat protein
MLDYVVISFWAFLAWYLPKLEEGKKHEDIIGNSVGAGLKNLDGVYFQLGMVHESMMQYMRAVVNFKEAARINPRMDKAHFGIGKNYILAERYEKAVKPLEKAVKLNPDETLAAIYLGWVNSQLGNHDKAAEILKKALSFSATCPSCGIKHHKNAEMAATAVIQIPGQSVSLRVGNTVENSLPLSTSPANDHDNADIAKPEEQGLKIEFDGQNLVDAKLAVTLYRYGLAHIKMEEYFPAMIELTEAVRLDPGFTDAHYALGLAYERMGMHKESVAEYILALKDKPAFHEAKFKLEEEVTLDELKLLLPEHFAPEENPAPAPTHHHTMIPTKILPLKRPKNFKEFIKPEGWGKAIKQRIARFY